jgi:hypothetical protein
MAQPGLGREYIYDAAGNRTIRKFAVLPAPPPTDSITNYELEITNDDLQTTDRSPQTANLSPLNADFFVEKISQVEIKIYPNPTTEKITMEISNFASLSTGVFKLYSLSGQLLQERTVHSVSTEVSLAGLARGAYILRVQINDHTEDWKIIKN